MAVRWAATTFRETEQNLRRLTGYWHLWTVTHCPSCRIPCLSYQFWERQRGRFWHLIYLFRTELGPATTSDACMARRLGDET